MDQQPWSLTLIGGVRIKSPSGEEVNLATRKAGGILCVLGAAEGKPVDRSLLESILWPDREDRLQSQSLRAALAELRRALGDDGPLETSRTTCRLRMDRVSTDYPPRERSLWAQLASDQSGTWFNDLRQGRVRLESSLENDEKPDELFAKVLHWAADIDPIRALDLMRAAPDLASVIPGIQLTELVKRLWPHVEPIRPLYGWLLHFRGVTEYLRGEVKPGLQSFQSASQIAMENQDTRLLGETVRWLSAPKIMTGDAAGAARIIEKSVVVAEKLRDGDAVALLLHGLAVAYQHINRPRDANEAFERALAASYYQRRMPERSQLLGNQAMFQAVEGDYAKADACLREIRQIGQEDSNWRVTAAMHLAQAVIFIGLDNLNGAESELGEILARESQANAQFTTIDVYAREWSAILHLRRGRLTIARRHLRHAAEMRQSASMGFTPWDKKRLAPILRAIKKD